MRNPNPAIQLLLDEARCRNLASEARRRRVSVVTVIREAIDQLLADAGQRRAAVQEIFGAEPMTLPSDPGALRRELDAVHDPAG